MLYPPKGGPQIVLPVTRQRVSETCDRGLCWLEGGIYKVPAGRFSVVAIFDEEPLPVETLEKLWRPEAWGGPTRWVERFELEVVR